MERLKKIFTAVLVAALCIFAFAGCSKKQENGRKQESGIKQERGPLDVKKVTYLIYIGDQPIVELYILTDDHKVTEYYIRTDDNKQYDYLAGELPPADKYEVKEYEIEGSGWESMVNVLTRVDFMNLLDEFKAYGAYDASTYYIKVETADGVHTSGGYGAGMAQDPESRRFSEARQYIENALQQTVN